jgi:hypothetical protein
MILIAAGNGLIENVPLQGQPGKRTETADNSDETVSVCLACEEWLVAAVD